MAINKNKVQLQETVLDSNGHPLSSTDVNPLTSSDCVYMENGMTLEDVMGNDTVIDTPTIMNEDTSFKVGVGDSETKVIDSDVAKMVIEGKTYQNILPKPTTLIMNTDEKEFKINDKIDSSIVLDDNIAEIATVKGQTYVNVVQEESATEYTVLGEELSGQSITTIGKPEGYVKNATLEGLTLVNTIQEPSGADATVLELDADIDAQNATIDNTVQGGIHGATLKGQTLVNLCNSNIRSQTLTASSRIFYCKIPYTIKANSIYTLFAKISNSTTSGQINLQLAHPDGTYSYPKIMDASTNGVVNTNIVNAKDITNILIYISNVDTGQVTVSDVMIIEGNYANVNIPYFEGMKSVEVPSVKTTGKNLFDGELEIGRIDQTTGENQVNNTMVRSKNFVKVKPSTTYTLSYEVDQGLINVAFYGSNKEFLGVNISKTPQVEGSLGRYVNISTTNDTHYLRFYSNSALTITNTAFKSQLEESPTLTTYEPYKSSTLTTPSDVILRKIGNVQDELDLETGKLTQRISEVVLNGSEDWIIGNAAQNTGETMFFATSDFDSLILKGGLIISDKFNKGSTWNSDLECLDLTTVDAHNFRVRILKTKLATQDAKGFKQWLQQNPVTVQYQLATPNIKTVDLSIVDQSNKSLKTKTILFVIDMLET